MTSGGPAQGTRASVPGSEPFDHALAVGYGERGCRGPSPSGGVPRAGTAGTALPRFEPPHTPPPHSPSPRGDPRPTHITPPGPAQGHGHPRHRNRPHSGKTRAQQRGPDADRTSARHATRCRTEELPLSPSRPGPCTRAMVSRTLTALSPSIHLENSLRGSQIPRSPHSRQHEQDGSASTGPHRPSRGVRNISQQQRRAHRRGHHRTLRSDNTGRSPTEQAVRGARKRKLTGTGETRACGAPPPALDTASRQCPTQQTQSPDQNPTPYAEKATPP